MMVGRPRHEAVRGWIEIIRRATIELELEQISSRAAVPLQIVRTAPVAGRERGGGRRGEIVYRVTAVDVGFIEHRRIRGQRGNKEGGVRIAAGDRILSGWRG